MSRFNHHFLAMLPLFSILSMSPVQLESNLPSRSIASEVAAAHPKYEARASKIDRTKIEIDKDLDLNCFSERGEALRERLMTERKEYKVDLVEKDGVAAQKARLQGLVSSLVEFEEDMKALKEKKAFEPEGEKIAEGTINELKTTLESLLIDEIENELNVLKAEHKQDDEEKPEVVVETPKPPVQTEAEKQLCELEDKNKVLTKQVEDLLAQQKTIMETMLGMNKMMIQMNQQMQQQQQGIPQWLLSGSMMNPQLLYPTTHGTTIIMVGGQQSMPQQSFIGQNTLNQGAFQYQQPQMPQMPQYPQPQSPYMEYDPRYSLPQSVVPGSFGQSPFQFSFGTTPFNQLPIQTA